MKTITLRAHFDGQPIQLDEPFELQPNTELIITILPVQPLNEEDNDWAAFSGLGLEAAYNEDELEYPLPLIVPDQRSTPPA